MQIYLKPYPHNTYSNIPYAAEDEREDGTQNFGFFDVKKYPGKIKKIPELIAEPELTDFVVKLNKESIFASSGCGIYKATYGKNQTYWSFVNIHFANIELNRKENQWYEQVGAFLMRYGDIDLAHENAIVEWIMNPTNFHDMKKIRKGAKPNEDTVLFQGWSLNVKLLGIGPDEETAKELWKIGLRNVNEFLCGELM